MWHCGLQEHVFNTSRNVNGGRKVTDFWRSVLGTYVVMENSTGDSGLHRVEQSNIHPLVYLGSVLSTTWTILANLVILVCFYRNRRRQWTSFSRQTCSMTVSDLLVGFTAIPLLVMEQQDGRTYTPVCLTTFYLYFSIQSVTLLHVLGICIFRNIQLKTISDTVQNSRQFMHANCVIVISWAFSLSVILFPIIVWGQRGEGLKVCYINNLFGHHHREAMVYIGTFYCISQGLTNIIYIITCARLRAALRTVVPIDNDGQLATVSSAVSTMPDTRPMVQHATSANRHTTGRRVNSTQLMSQPVASILRSQKQVLVTIGILLLIFNIFTLPFTMLLFVERSEPLNRNMRFLCGGMFMVNSGLNPIVYATRIASIRESVKALYREILCVSHM